MSRMTLEEKLAQIEGIRPNDLMIDGKLSLEKCREIIPHGIGHFCQFSSSLTMSPSELRDFVREIQHYLMTETRTKIPAIFHEEAITGFATQGATTFPQQIGMGCSWNEDQIIKNSASTRRNMRAAGATYALSPMLDLSRTAHWERIEESYGEDAYLTSALGLAFVNGLQGEDISNGVAATTKHFAGYGTQNNNSKEFHEEYLMPHEVVIKKGNVKSVMPSYGRFKGKAVVTSKEMLTTILREKLGFDGVVVSDYGAINLTYTGHKLASSSKEAAVMALNAGTDIELAKPIAFPYLPEALKEGLVSQEKIDDAVKRSLIMKARLDLLDENPAIGVDGELDFDPPANRKLAYESACQSIVLLKNNGILPLKKDVKKIALVGPNAATVHGLLGDYTYQSMISFWWGKSFDPNNPKLISLSEGLHNVLGDDVSIAHERGCDWSAPLESMIKKDGLGDSRLAKVKMLTIKDVPQPNLDNAIKISKESDVIIAVMGENIYLCGEGRERKGIRLPGEQEAFVKQLIATGKPVILVMYGGRPQVVNELEKGCAAIVQAWFPGEEGGQAIADIMIGKVNPSAKLCITYPKSEDKTEVNYKNEYTNEEPQYPFGYGLSYTNYTYSDLQLNSSTKITDDRFEIACKVKNTGEKDGTEIVQLYVSPTDENSSMKPIQLKGFQRVDLKAGEEKSIKFLVSPEQLVQYKNDQWIVVPGKYDFKLAASCTDIRLSGTINIKGDAKILKNGRSVFFSKNQ
ncbi:glycoside hydrolase family 3 C-terminal domain-containing protein [Labilibaculum sp. DW002]|uniref:Glycoside hydrolase family 3 C-terminal domain-containing protein n=1 Tax=Paralabilibaculum antarcticum TaxID=2912572 RepID=A0ABT5VQ23_9BACT|nr:glycoside hydrolase family 3 N-terminal domain-containing protein [Labilibaculum sp. DW002]MDE5417529.1 glycoside hydrolase family 3 C-terminal domain-containing protein [Labilibaculum sp. DW002]